MLVRCALVLALATSGCAASRPDAAEAPTAAVGPVRIPLGDAVVVERVPIRFDAVTEDSRCPPDVQCVWAGRAHVRLVIGGEAVELSVPGLAPTDAAPAEATRRGLTVRALSMTPKAPASSGAGDPELQWVELDVTRA